MFAFAFNASIYRLKMSRESLVPKSGPKSALNPESALIRFRLALD